MQEGSSAQGALWLSEELPPGVKVTAENGRETSLHTARNSPTWLTRGLPWEP